jgi:hypothetical protein
MMEFGCDPILNVYGCFSNDVVVPFQSLCVVGGILGIGACLMALRWSIHDKFRASVLTAAMSLLANLMLSVLILAIDDPVVLLIALSAVTQIIICTIYLCVGEIAKLASTAIDLRRTKFKSVLMILTTKRFRLIAAVFVPLCECISISVIALILVRLYPEDRVLMLRYLTIAHRAACFVEGFAALMTVLVIFFCTKSTLKEYAKSKPVASVVTHSRTSQHIPQVSEFEVRMNLILIFSAVFMQTIVAVIIAMCWDMACTFHFDEHPLYILPTWIAMNLLPGYMAFGCVCVIYLAMKQKKWAQYAASILYRTQMKKDVTQKNAEILRTQVI